MKIQPDQLTIRPFSFSDADYAASVAVKAAILPEYKHRITTWKLADKNRNPDYLYKRFVIELDDAVIGSTFYGEVSWSHRPGKLNVGIDLHPEQQGRGIGRIVYNWLLTEIAQYNPNTLTCGSREDFANAIAFLEKEGFELVMRAPVSRLDVASFSARPEPAEVAESFTSLPAKVASNAIRIRTVSELMQSDPDYKRNLWELKWQLLQDVPTDEPMSKMPFEEWVKKQLENPQFDPDAWFIAEDINSAEQPCYVGLSNLWIDHGHLDLIGTGLTGVKREYRRNGIALALKLRAIAYAQEIGAKELETDNEENNPMYGINMQLGFEPKPAWVEYKKTGL